MPEKQKDGGHYFIDHAWQNTCQLPGRYMV